MFIAYTDTSGRPYGDKENYVLASIIINEAEWQSIDNNVKQIKLTHFPTLPDEDVEMHAKDMMNHDRLFQSLSWNSIYSVLDDIFGLISNVSTDLCIIGVVIEKNKLQKSINTESWAYRLLFERINRFLERKNQLLMEKQHPPQFGISTKVFEGQPHWKEHL